MAATDETRELVRRALERENPFAGSTFDGPRLIWHPEVHRLFGERCVFFILQIQDPQLGPTEEEVGLLVSKAGAAARAVYPLYGYYDVLVRAWVTPAIRDRLVGEFHEAVGLVAAYEEFQVETARYLWVGPYEEKGPYDLEPRRAMITELCDSIAGAKAPNEADVLALHDDGLIHVVPQRSRGSVRFYVALSPRRGTVAGSRGLVSLTESLRRNDLDFVSIYSGIGFASHLLGFVAPSFNDVASYVQRLTPIAEKFTSRTVTFVIATSGVVESDGLNPHAAVPAPEMASLAKILGGQAEAEIQTLPDGVQRQLAHIFRDYSDLLGTEFEGVFLGLLRARVANDLNVLNRELAVALHFEMLLKDFLQRIFNAYLERGWQERILDLAANVPRKTPPEVRQPPQRVSDMSIGTLAQVTHQLVLSGELDDGLVRPVLGEDWPERLELFASAVRNPLAHGVAFTADYEAEFLENWEERADLLCEIGRAYVRLLARSGVPAQEELA